MNKFLELPDNTLIRWDAITSVTPLDTVPIDKIGERIVVRSVGAEHLVYFPCREERDAFVRYIKSELAALV